MTNEKMEALSKAAIAYDIKTVYINAPPSVRAFVSSNSDSSYTIFLNSIHTHETIVNAYFHELEHIVSGDHNCSDADQIEKRRHEE